MLPPLRESNFSPSRKKRKLGVAVILHSAAISPARPTPRSTETKPTRALPARERSRARRSNWGSITRHGGQVAGLVKNATTARDDLRTACSEAEEVASWRGEESVVGGGGVELADESVEADARAATWERREEVIDESSEGDTGMGRGRGAVVLVDGLG